MLRAIPSYKRISYFVSVWATSTKTRFKTDKFNWIESYRFTSANGELKMKKIQSDNRTSNKIQNFTFLFEIWNRWNI